MVHVKSQFGLFEIRSTIRSPNCFADKFLQIFSLMQQIPLICLLKGSRQG